MSSFSLGRLAAMRPDKRDAALCGSGGIGWVEAAARDGLVEAQVLLGQLHLDGRIQPSWPGLAFRWFSAAAEAGYPPALNMVGRCLEHGWDTAPDLAGAAVHYRRAAEAGLDWGQFNLGCVLLYGIGVARDREEAHRWFMRAAEQGLGKAMNMIGRFHDEGWDRAADEAEAARWFAAAADAGDFRGQFNLASILHRRGQVEEAVAWLRRAVAGGSADFLAEVSDKLGSSPDPRLRAVAREAWTRFEGGAGAAATGA